MTEHFLFAVKAISKNGGGVYTLRRFKDDTQAAKHALTVNMDTWGDVWVEPEIVVVQEYSDPKFPWSVTWIGGYAYVTDANGRKIASLLGTQKQREFVAAFLHDITRERESA